MEKDTATETDKKAITPEQAKDLAEKAPSLLRRRFANLPDMSDHIDERINGLGKIAMISGVGMGAVLGGASLTRFIPGKWKWVSGTAAVGSAAVGLYANHKSGKVADAFNYASVEINKAVLKYADTIENDETARKQLADYFLNNITPHEMAALTPFKAPGFLTGKAIEFGQASQYLDTESVENNMKRNWHCYDNPNKPGCEIVR